MQKYWLQSSKSLQKVMNRFFLTRNLILFFGKRLSFILMKLQNQKCHLEHVSRFPLKMLFLGGSMQKYWLRRSKSLENGMN